MTPSVTSFVWEAAMKVLTGATLIDGTGRKPVADAAVVIDGERIMQAGPRGSVKYPSSAEVVDLKGLTLMPGLIDCHDHLNHHTYSLMDRWELDAPASYRALRTATVLRELLEMGYTAVREGGGLDAGFKQGIEDGLIQGPRLMLSVTLISPTGGLADVRSPSGHCCPVPTSLSLPSGVADGVDACRAKVREMQRVGADVIKIASTGGASSRPRHGPFDHEFTREELDAIVNEAHDMGMKVMCHALGGPGLRRAIEAGVDSIEHGTYLTQDPDVIPMMAEKGIFYVPTLLVYVFHRDNPMKHSRERARALEKAHKESVRAAMKAGVRVAAGTDSGGWGHPLNSREVELLTTVGGLSNMEALQSAMGIASQCLGMEREIGTVEKGKLADLVAVAGDPLKDIKVLQDKSKIRMVMKGGEGGGEEVGGSRRRAV